jgi:Dna[CI] antecedent, DciA
MQRPRNPDLAARLFGAKPEHTLALLRAAWPTAVGEELARRTQVVALDRGVLRVMVPDVRWQRSLLRVRGDILARLRTVAGRASPRMLGFVTGPVADSAPKATPASPVVDHAEAPAAVRKAAESIPDPEIRARFLETASRYLSRFGRGQADTTGAPPSGSAGGSSSSG